MAARSDPGLRRVGTALTEQLAAAAAQPVPLARSRRLLFVLVDANDTLATPTTRRPMSLADHLATRASSQAMVDQGIDQVCAGDSATLITSRLMQACDTLLNRLAHPLPASVASRFGDTRVADFLRGVLLELVAAGLASGGAVVPSAATEAARTLAAGLLQRHPGQVLELRIPPATAVQLAAFGLGPTHTRGTPPNVAELGVADFVRLGLGFDSWDGLRATHRVSASGAHVDALAAMVPVIDLSS